MTERFRIILICISLIATIHAVRRTCSKSYDGISFCQYIVGDGGSNIIISAPHGGDLKPPTMGTRDAGCFVNGKCVWSKSCGEKDFKNCPAKTAKDAYTKELAVQLAYELTRLTGYHPHLIINDLHRSKLDANREINEATFGYGWATTTFREFHNFISSAKSSISGRGLYIDMHGQNSDEGWNELGYMVTKTRLNNDTPLSKYSSLKYLASQTSVSFENILRGRYSLGQMLHDEGVAVVPSYSIKKPQSGDYRSGGYNIQTYGSRYGGKIDGVQVETHTNYRNSNYGPTYAKALARAIKRFMDVYY